MERRSRFIWPIGIFKREPTIFSHPPIFGWRKDKVRILFWFDGKTIRSMNNVWKMVRKEVDSNRLLGICATFVFIPLDKCHFFLFTESTGFSFGFLSNDGKSHEKLLARWLSKKKKCTKAWCETDWRSRKKNWLPIQRLKIKVSMSLLQHYHVLNLRHWDNGTRFTFTNKYNNNHKYIWNKGFIVIIIFGFAVSIWNR